jgi:hypothetical protein
MFVDQGFRLVLLNLLRLVWIAGEITSLQDIPIDAVQIVEVARGGFKTGLAGGGGGS